MGDDCDDGLDELTALLQGGQLNRMDSLLLRQIKDDRHLSNCFEFMDQLKLVLYGDAIGKRALPALTPHFTTLEHLSIPLSGHIIGELTLAVLESCPMLKYLQGLECGPLR